MGPKLPGGGLSLELSTLREQLEEYFGQLNEIRAGAKPENLVDQPEILKYLTLMQELNLPLCSGGLEDQPYIFVQELAMALHVKRIFESVRIDLTKKQ